MNTCAVCLEGSSPSTTALIDDSPVCHRCTIQIFELAIQHEDNYPPRWGARTLDIKDFDWIPEGVRSSFTRSEREYLTSPAERIYCQVCNTFVAPQTAHHQKEAECPECSTSHCAMCGELRNAVHSITCTVKLTSNEHSAFVGLVLGQDYQICPSKACGRRLQLSDGCNHLLCRCGTSLCYICGRSVEENEHYKSKEKGGCPRYHHPDDPRAVWPTLDSYGLPAAALIIAEERMVVSRDATLQPATARLGWSTQRRQQQDPVRDYPSEPFLMRTFDLDVFARMPLTFLSLTQSLVPTRSDRRLPNPLALARPLSSRSDEPTSLHLAFPPAVSATLLSEQVSEEQDESSQPG